MAAYKKRSSPKTLLHTVIAFVILLLLSAFGVTLSEPLSDLLGVQIPSWNDLFAGGENAVIPEGVMRVHFIDVGQADCILVEAGGETLLVDAGDLGGYDEIAEYLDEAGVKRLDYVIGTHPHADHIGSMAQILQGYEIGCVYLPELDESIVPTTRVYERMMEAIEEKDIPLYAAEPLDTFSVGEAIVTILGPVEQHDDLNDMSIVCRVAFGNTSFMLTGDAELPAETDMLQLATTFRSTVLKMGHHGSSTSTGDGWWQAVSPAYCVISCGVDNKYGHPHQETLARLADAGIEPYRTDWHGDIVFTVENDQISVHTENAA